MALPGSGAISFSDIATELGRSGTSVNFSQSDVLLLAGKSAGQSVILPDDFWGKSSGSVTLSDTYTVFSNSFVGSTAQAQIIFNTNGVIDLINDNNTFNESWWSNAPTSNIGANYEIRATIISGNLTNGSQNVWLSLNSQRAWEKSTNIIGTDVVVFTLEIRNLSGTILDSSEITLSATVEP